MYAIVRDDSNNVAISLRRNYAGGPLFTLRGATFAVAGATPTEPPEVTEPEPPDPDPAALIHSTTHHALDWDGRQELATLAQVAADGHDHDHIREQDDIIFDAQEPDPARRWKFYFSAPVDYGGTYNSGQSHIFVCFSADLATWSTPVHCTVGGSPMIQEDTSIVQTLSTQPVAHRDAGRLVMYAENVSRNIDVLSSTDGVAWTVDALSVIARGATGEWDRSLVGSPTARHNGTQYVVFYEGISGDNMYEYGGIASGVDPTALTKNPANPIFKPDDLGFIGKRSAFVDSFWITPDGSKIILTGHSGLTTGWGGVTEITSFRAYTTNLDPLTWASGVGMFHFIGTLTPWWLSDITCDYYGGRLIAHDTTRGNYMAALPLIP